MTPIVRLPSPADVTPIIIIDQIESKTHLVTKGCRGVTRGSRIPRWRRCVQRQWSPQSTRGGSAVFHDPQASAESMRLAFLLAVVCVQVAGLNPACVSGAGVTMESVGLESVPEIFLTPQQCAEIIRVADNLEWAMTPDSVDSEPVMDIDVFSHQSVRSPSLYKLLAPHLPGMKAALDRRFGHEPLVKNSLVSIPMCAAAFLDTVSVCFRIGSSCAST